MTLIFNKFTVNNYGKQLLLVILRFFIYISYDDAILIKGTQKRSLDFKVYYIQKRYFKIRIPKNNNNFSLTK